MLKFLKLFYQQLIDFNKHFCEAKERLQLVIRNFAPEMSLLHEFYTKLIAYFLAENIKKLSLQYPENIHETLVEKSFVDAKYLYIFP